jgi:branched-chain amino acid transport system substrate-binding protein
MAPMTGDIAYLGEELKQLGEFVQEYINANGGVDGVPIKFIFEDDQGTSVGATTAFRKLQSVDNVNAIIGPLFSSCLLSIVKDLNEFQIPTLVGTIANPGVFSENGYVFSIDVKQSTVANKEVEFMRNKGFSKLALLGLYNDMTIHKFELFNELFVTAGGEVVAEESFQSGKTEFRTELTKVKKANPDVIYIYVDTPELIKIVRQMTELRLNKELWICTDFQAINEDIFSQIGEIVDGRFSYATGNPPVDADAQKVLDIFSGKYMEKFGVEPSSMTCLIYDCIDILTNAVEASGEYSGQGLRDAIYTNTQGYIGTTGPVSYNTDGSCERVTAILVYENGEVSYFAD